MRSRNCNLKKILQKLFDTLQQSNHENNIVYSTVKQEIKRPGKDEIAIKSLKNIKFPEDHMVVAEFLKNERDH